MFLQIGAPSDGTSDISFFLFFSSHSLHSLVTYFFPPRYANRRAVRKISRPLFNPRYRACPTMWIRNRGNSYTILEMAIIAKVRCHDRNLIIRKLDHHHAVVSVHKFLFKNVATRSINASLVDQNLLRTMEPVEFPELYFLYVFLSFRLIFNVSVFVHSPSR